MAKIACKVVDGNKPEVYVEVMVDNITEDEEAKIHSKVEELATYVANLKGMRVKGQGAIVLGK